MSVCATTKSEKRKAKSEKRKAKSRSLGFAQDDTFLFLDGVWHGRALTFRAWKQKQIPRHKPPSE